MMGMTHWTIWIKTKMRGAQKPARSRRSRIFSRSVNRPWLPPQIAKRTTATTPMTVAMLISLRYFSISWLSLVASRWAIISSRCQLATRRVFLKTCFRGRNLKGETKDLFFRILFISLVGFSTLSLSLFSFKRMPAHAVSD